MYFVFTLENKPNYSKPNTKGCMNFKIECLFFIATWACFVVLILIMTYKNLRFPILSSTSLHHRLSVHLICFSIEPNTLLFFNGESFYIANTLYAITEWSVYQPVIPFSLFINKEKSNHKGEQWSHTLRHFDRYRGTQKTGISFSQELSNEVNKLQQRGFEHIS